MIATLLRHFFRNALRIAGVATISLSPPAFAADASPWDGDARSALRLIAGAAAHGSGPILRAGVEIKLSPGWKTYWRYPGDSGVPPRFDFTMSRNLKAATVLWPAPQRFVDEAGQSIGYKSDVIFPLRIVPQVAGQPVELHLKVDYAICEKLCIPVESHAELSLTEKVSSEESALATAEARVPVPTAFGTGALAIRSVRRSASGNRPHVLVEVVAPAGEPVDLFVEGPTTEWALPLPRAVIDTGPSRQFAFDLDGIPPGAKAEGSTLKFTLVSPTHAIEVATRLD